MVTVWLHREDCEEGTLPGLCLLCGGPTELRVEKDFRSTLVWRAPFVFLSAPCVRVRVPLCGCSRRHWRNSFLRRASVAFVAACLLGVPTVASSVTDSGSGSCLNCCPMCCSLLLVFVALRSLDRYLVALLRTAIRAGEIREQGIQLINVSEEFAEAYEQQRERVAGALEQAAAERWKERHGHHPASEDGTSVVRSDDVKLTDRRESMIEPRGEAPRP
jgi:hypothetical protein